ncbi:MAG: rRNA pseudouridine synthase [Sphaerochaetaceae bacterium]|nr:rRNA pseudouridine synthase [Sphaerochaetaceae bacterium]
MGEQRLDKVLSQSKVGSRKDCETFIRRGRVAVDGIIVKKSDIKVNDSCVITLDDKPIIRRRKVVCIMNKAKGYVTATEDEINETVMTFLPQEFLNQEVAPVGRLDKDTEGLLVFTNDGNLNHRLISPKHEVPKVYYVEHERPVLEEHILMARNGIVLKDNSICKSAIVKPCNKEGVYSSLIQIREGMYHQVKRMYGAMGLGLLSLKRVQIGSITLGSLKSGEVRELTEVEIEGLFDTDSSILFEP